MSMGSVLAVLFIIQMIHGKKYDEMVEPLDEGKYPLSSLYIVGLSWNASKWFMLRGKNKADLKLQASLIYGQRYSEYYAIITWAQMLTFTHLFLAMTLLISSIMYDSVLFMLAAGGFMTIILAMYCRNNMKDTIAKRTEECEGQLAEIVSTMAILVSSGMVLREAWTLVSDSGEGAFYELMKKAKENMRNGYSDADAIFLFGRDSNSPEIKKFTSALLQSMEKGGGELGSFLARQSSELWNAKRQKMLQSGEKASAKLLLPIMLIFFGVIIIVITAAFGGTLF